MCLVGSLKFLPPDPQAFQSMMGSHKFSPDNGRCFDWRLSSLTVGMPLLLLTHSTINAPMLIQAEAMFGATQRQDLKRACTLYWSGIPESNWCINLGKVSFYH